MDKLPLYFIIILFTAGITFLLHIINRELRNCNKKEWIISILIVLIPIIICTYAIGAYISYLYNISQDNQIYVHLTLMLISVVLPVSISYINRNLVERNQNELTNRLEKLRNNPNITNEQKALIDAIIDNNKYL